MKEMTNDALTIDFCEDTYRFIPPMNDTQQVDFKVVDEIKGNDIYYKNTALS